MKKHFKIILTFTLTIASGASFAEKKGTNYNSITVSSNAHFNDRPIRENGETTFSAGISLDLEKAVRLSEKFNAVANGSIGYENKSGKDVVGGPAGKSYFSSSVLIGPTYNLTENLSAGLGMRVYLGESAVSRGAVSTLIRYKVKSGILTADVEKNIGQEGFGIRLGAGTQF